MDQQVLERLDQIETAAEKILSDAEGRKVELLKANEERIAEFDRTTRAQADEKIAGLREKLQTVHETEEAALKDNTDRMLQRLEREYRLRKAEIAEEIVTEILQ